MNLVKESLRNWFGFTRRERRSTFMLLIIMVVVAALRFAFPERNATIEEIFIDFKDNKADSISVSTVSAISEKLKAPERINQRKQTTMNINTCDSTALVSLPGIGPVLSSRIIRYRNLLGGYFSVDQLKEVYGLSEETFNLISSRLFADPIEVRKIRINNADYKELIRLPYFERYQVSAILKYRELKGKIESVDDMIKNNLITPEKIPRIIPYLDFGEY
jgi:DNA uptake protein ComE-like DNA-binding protein